MASLREPARKKVCTHSDRRRAVDAPSAAGLAFGGGGSSFSFGFGNEDDANEDAATNSSAAASDEIAPPLLPEGWVPSRSQEHGVATENVFVVGGLSLCRGDAVCVDWSKSNHFQLMVRIVKGKGEGQGYVRPRSIMLVRTAKDEEMRAAFRHSDADSMSPHAGNAAQSSKEQAPPAAPAPADESAPAGLTVYDAVWDKPRALTASPSFVDAPLQFEPGLESFAWPLTPAEFVRRVYRRKAFAVLGTGQRLEQLHADFADLAIEPLLAAASRTVVWMRKQATGEMQYLEAPSPAVAHACYEAGHSLYFNPSLEVQRKYVQAMCLSLGMDFACDLNGSVGGDLEVFAVKGKHHTPWHFDAQENFTIQLRGTKRWTVAPSGIADPITNCHPRSSNTEALARDYRAHAAYTNAPLPPKSFDGAQTFVLRPGSCMYLPAGMWHTVEAEDEEGSLSINMSVQGMRWGQLLVSRLVPLLWSKKGWRERVHARSPESTRAHLDELLKALPHDLHALTARSMLPDALFLGSRPVSVLRAGQEDEGGGAAERSEPTAGETVTYVRNPLASLVRKIAIERPGSGDDKGGSRGRASTASNTVAYTVHHGCDAESLESDLSLTITVPTRRAADMDTHARACPGKRYTAPKNDDLVRILTRAGYFHGSSSSSS